MRKNLKLGASAMGLMLFSTIVVNCGDKSMEDPSINSNSQNLNGCDLNGQCTTPGQFCYSHQDPASGILWCDVTDPLNKHYTSSCVAGYYCEEGLFDECMAGEVLLRCDLSMNVLVPSTCGDGYIASNEACDENDGNGPCDGACNATCTAVLTGCGDGQTCGTEACDDGDSVSNDGCDANCEMTGCGNGEQTVGEGCDDGNQTNDDGCDDDVENGGTCQPTGCGNGVVAGNEMCDDGNPINGDGCDNDCTTSECGNGIVVTGEQCDDGNNINSDGCQANCMLPDCGDGWLDPNEECDEGEDNDNEGDCTEQCTNAVCGDGFVYNGDGEGGGDGGEQCDDGAGNGFGNDCNPDCTLPTCGDGTVDPNEECDDDNNANGDGCDANCVIEPDCVEEDPVPCQIGAYGCLQGTSESYCLAAGNVLLECQCFNAGDFNKGTWLEPGADCDTACWNEGSGGSGAGGSGGGGGGPQCYGQEEDCSDDSLDCCEGLECVSGACAPVSCADDGEDCSEANCCEGLSCVDSGENVFICVGETECVTDDDCPDDFVCDAGDCEPPVGVNMLTFTWFEPEGYDQPNSDVAVEGQYTGGPSWGTLCTMVPVDGSVWSCSAAVPEGVSLYFNIRHADPLSTPSGQCFAFDQCAWYCAGNGSNFGSVDVDNAVDVPYTQVDNGIDPFSCSQNGFIASVPGGS